MSKVVLADGLKRIAVWHEMRVLDASAMTIHTRHRYDLRCIATTRFFQRRFTWTGTGIEAQPVIEPAEDEAGHRMHNLHGPVIREGNNRNLMVVDLGRTLDVGDEVSVEMSHRFVDTGGKFVRYVGQKAPAGMRSLDLRLLLPPALPAQVRSARQSDGSDHSVEVPGLTKTSVVLEGIPFDQYELQVIRPERAAQYSIRFPAPEHSAV